MGARIEVVDGGQSQVGHMSGDVGALSECEVIIMTPH